MDLGDGAGDRGWAFSLGRGKLLGLDGPRAETTGVRGGLARACAWKRPRQALQSSAGEGPGCRAQEEGFLWLWVAGGWGGSIRGRKKPGSGSPELRHEGTASVLTEKDLSGPGLAATWVKNL